MDTFLVTGQKVLVSIPYFGVIALLLFIGKVFYDKTSAIKFDEELTTRDNPAFGVALAGYLLGLAIALGGLMFGTTFEPAEDFAAIGAYGALVVVLMRLSVVVNQKFILSRFSIETELIRDKNVGTGFVVAGSCVATGLMVSGALSGESESLLYGLRDITFYWFVGQVSLIIGGWIFCLIAGYDVHHEIGNDNNAAAGLSYGGFLVAIGIIAKTALAGASGELLTETITVSVIMVSGLILLVLGRYITDYVFLPQSRLAKEVAVDSNVAAGAIAAVSSVAVAQMFSVAVGA